MTTEHNYVCSICGKLFTGYGNNPYPVTTGKDDRCCDVCNDIVVIPSRLGLYAGGETNGEDAKH